MDPDFTVKSMVVTVVLMFAVAAFYASCDDQAPVVVSSPGRAEVKIEEKPSALDSPEPVKEKVETGWRVVRVYLNCQWAWRHTDERSSALGYSGMPSPSSFAVTFSDTHSHLGGETRSRSSANTVTYYPVPKGDGKVLIDFFGTKYVVTKVTPLWLTLKYRSTKPTKSVRKGG